LPPCPDSGFRHDALLYSGQQELVRGAASFVRDGLSRGEPVLVTLRPEATDRLRQALDGASRDVHFLDMAQVGRNPARLIPAWRDFVDGYGGDSPVRGVGEPVWAGRSAAELVECRHHEALLNLAFGDGPPWWLLCPYDVSALPPAVVRDARSTHPGVLADGRHARSTDYRAVGEPLSPSRAPLPEPPMRLRRLSFSDGSAIASVRQLVRHAAEVAGLGAVQIEELVLAVDEVAANSLRHGGGAGVLRVWADGRSLVCEVSDSGGSSSRWPAGYARQPTRSAGAGCGSPTSCATSCRSVSGTPAASCGCTSARRPRTSSPPPSPADLRRTYRGCRQVVRLWQRWRREAEDRCVGGGRGGPLFPVGGVTCASCFAREGSGHGWRCTPEPARHWPSPLPCS
jgi:MEDS: MEthanogen/methylotroph, DcmR Sensory domain/Histidine kinase-like ATPase domain